MTIKVKCFDERKAHKVLKSCPKIVRDYVQLLERNIEIQRGLISDAIRKLSEKKDK
jgi:hypothetical protein